MGTNFYSITPTTNKLRARLVALAAGLLLAPAAWAQAPANDNCTGAIALTAGTTCTAVTGNNTNATASGTPAPSCGGATTTASNDVWYSVVVPAGGAVQVSTSLVTGSPFTDTVLELYSGSCGSLTSIGCNDDAGGVGPSSVTARNLMAGSTIYARVFGYGTTPTGTFGICAAIPAAAPANDDPAGAITLPVGATCTPVNGTNVAATTTTPAGYMNGTNPNMACGIAINPKDVWYKFTTPASGPGSTAVSIQVTGNSAGYLRMFSSPGGSASGPFTEVGCASGGNFNTVSRPVKVTTLTPNTTYYVFVSGYGSADTQGAFTICATAVPNNDAAVGIIYSLAKVPVGAAQTTQVRITNEGISALTNLPVTLTVTGANTFTDVKTVASLAAGASATVTFAPFTASAVGTNTLTVTVPADGLTTNNSRTYTQVVNTNTFSYADNSAIDPNLSIGFTATTTGAFIAKYTTATARTLTGITVALADPNSVGRTVYGVAVSSTGAVLARTPDYTIATADLNQRKNFALSTPLGLAAGDFYVGLVQTAVPAGGARYFPLGTLPEEPTRPNTFFVISPFTPGTGGMLTDAASNNLGIFVIEAVTGTVQGTSEALNRAINMYPNPSAGVLTLDIRNAKANGAMQVQVTNMLGQAVHTATVRDNTINNLDLSGLSNGVYLVRVSSGSEYTTRQLVLTK